MQKQKENQGEKYAWQSLWFSLDLDSLVGSKHAGSTFLHPSSGCPTYFSWDYKQLPALQLIHIFYTHSEYNIQGKGVTLTAWEGLSLILVFLLVLETAFC